MNKMRNKILILISLLLAISTVSAYGCNMQEVEVNGHVYNKQGMVLQGAIINVSCSHFGNITMKRTISNLDGEYTAMFDKRQCDYGDAVNVSTDIFSKTDKIRFIYPSKCSVDVDMIAMIPEFSLLTMLFTVICAACIIQMKRQK